MWCFCGCGNSCWSWGHAEYVDGKNNDSKGFPGHRILSRKWSQNGYERAVVISSAFYKCVHRGLARPRQYVAEAGPRRLGCETAAWRWYAGCAHCSRSKPFSWSWTRCVHHFLTVRGGGFSNCPPKPCVKWMEMHPSNLLFFSALLNKTVRRAVLVMTHLDAFWANL